MPDVVDELLRSEHDRIPVAPSPLRTDYDDVAARRSSNEQLVAPSALRTDYDDVATRRSSNEQLVAPSALRTDYDEVSARRSLRLQIAKLERELGALFATAYPRKGLEWRVPAPGGPRVLGVGELEQLRDALAERLEDGRRTLRDCGYVEQKNLARIDAMIAEPARFKWVRISNADIGEPGCKYWHSRPKLGLIGMLLGWWRVKISSGCP